jgi:hypothetical protein
MGSSHDESVAIVRELREDFKEVAVSLEPGDPSRQGQQFFALGIREFFIPTREPVLTWLISDRIVIRIDAAVNDAQFLGVGFGIMASEVIFDCLGNTDDAFSLGDNGGIKPDRMEAVHSGEVMGAIPGGHLLPGEVAQPAGEPGTEVNDVGAMFTEEPFDRRDLSEGKGGLFVNGKVEMGAPFPFERFHKASAIGKDEGIVTL